MSDQGTADGAERRPMRRVNRQARAAEAREAEPRRIYQREADARDETDTGIEALGRQEAGPALPAREETGAIDTGDRRTRRYRGNDVGSDPFFLPAHRKRPGWDYEWKVVRVLNEPADSWSLSYAQEQGWRPEKASNWPELTQFDGGTDPNRPVDRGGQRLFGRPIGLTMDARQEDYDRANEQHRDKLRAAANGRMGGPDGPGLSDVRGVRPVPIQVELTGEAGTFTGPHGPAAQ